MVTDSPPARELKILVSGGFNAMYTGIPDLGLWL